MEALIHGITTITLGQIAMMLIGALLMYLGIKKDMNRPYWFRWDWAHFGEFSRNRRFNASCRRHQGRRGAGCFIQGRINTELFPLLIFIGIGAMIDFGPLLQNPFMLLFGAAAQFGISLPFLLQYSSASTLKRLLQSGSSGLPMVRHPFLFQTSWRRICWGPSQWRLIRTWHWCRLFNPWPSKQSQPSMNAAFG